MIDKLAYVHPDAKIGDNVRIGPWTYIDANVEIGDNCEIASHVVIKGHTKIGQNNRIFQFASIGEENQDKKYQGEPTLTLIGDNNVIRECVTIHRGTEQDEGKTVIGSHNLLMAYAHVAHDVVLGDHSILANVVTLAGHVHVGSHVIIGGLSGVHQFCHIGDHAFVAGASAVHKDIPPYVMCRSDSPFGVNLEGLKRRGFSKESLQAIRRAYKTVYRDGLLLDEALTALTDSAEQYPEVAAMVNFIKASQRGIVR